MQLLQMECESAFHLRGAFAGRQGPVRMAISAAGFFICEAFRRCTWAASGHPWWILMPLFSSMSASSSGMSSLTDIA